MAAARIAERLGVRHIRRKIDPGVELEEAQRRIGAGEKNGNDREAGLAPLPVEGEVALPLLPGPQAFGTDEHGNGAARGERLFQRLRPRLAGREVPAVEEDADAVLGQLARYPLHRRVVACRIAEEDVERARHPCLPFALSCLA